MEEFKIPEDLKCLKFIEEGIKEHNKEFPLFSPSEFEAKKIRGNSIGK